MMCGMRCTDLDCMGQYVAVQQLMQALLQGRQVAILDMRYAHQSLAEVTEQQLPAGVMQAWGGGSLCLCQLMGG